MEQQQVLEEGGFVYDKDEQIRSFDGELDKVNDLAISSDVAPAEESPEVAEPQAEPPAEEVPEPPAEEVQEPPSEEVQEPPSEEVQEPPSEEVTEPQETSSLPININYEILPEVSTPDLIFIVPYRDRQKQYEFFDKHMKMILEDYAPESYKILYIHQQDTREFNRGAIKNIGFIKVKEMYPDSYKNITLVFNDIDTMPYSKNFLNYKTTPGTVKHFYGFKFTLGGIVSITAGDFETINGFPNLWAWGYEDNMLQTRAIKGGLYIDRSQFFNILDSNILHFPEGITRNINRTEYDAYMSNTTEGIDTIYDILYQYDESTGFVNVQHFLTNRVSNEALTYEYDLRNGSMPFQSYRKPRGGRGAMKMIL